MLPGAYFLKSRFLSLLFSSLIFSSALAQAQDQSSLLKEEKKGIYAIVKDEKGEATEGLLRIGPDELLVRTKDNKEKSIPMKYIKSITLEKTKGEIPGEEWKKEPTYTVRVENSKEIYTLKKKYTFSLNTNVGLVTKTIDPELVNSLFSKEAASAKEEKPFIQDKSIVFSLEFKF